MRTIIRVSPRGDLTAHQAGMKPFPDHKTDWPVLMKVKDKRNRPIAEIVKHAYPALVRLYGL